MVVKQFRNPELIEESVKQPAMVWGARLLLGGGPVFMREEGIEQDRVSSILGMGYLEDCLRGRAGTEVEGVVEKQCRALAATEPKLPETIPENLKGLKEWLTLSPIETEILTVVAMATLIEELDDLFDAFEGTRLDGTAKALGEATGFSLREVSEAITEGSLLGIMKVGKEKTFGVGADNDAWNDLLATLLSPRWDSKGLVRLIGEYVEVPADPFDGSGYDAREVKGLSGVLDEVAGAMEKGGHILISGPAGVGKTEMAKGLASKLGRSLFSVPFAELEGSRSADGVFEVCADELRLNRYQQMQLVRDYYKHGIPVILFDEAECVLDEQGYSQRPQFFRPLVKSILEKKQAPTIWVCNDEVQVHPSVLHRFDHVVNIPLKGSPTTAG